MNRTIFTITLLFAILNDLSAVQLYIDPFEILAGETKEVSINFTQENETSYCAAQFDVYLPKGLELVMENNVYGVLNPNRTTTSKPHVLRSSFYNNVCYRFMVFAMSGTQYIKGTSGELIKVKIRANGEVEGGTQICEIKNIKLTTAPSPSTVLLDAQTTQVAEYIAKISDSGYGSFSWPYALDFSACDGVATVFRAATTGANGSCILEPIADKIVPANTGVILKGTAGKYCPTMISLASPVESTLIPTSDATYTVNYDKEVYALSTKNGKTGFYPCREGVIVPQFKCYLQGTSTTNAKEIIFLEEDLSDISSLSVDESEHDCYSLSGIKVGTPTRKNVYIQNGRKILIK
jgi:hypothetical protein